MTDQQQQDTKIILANWERQTQELAQVPVHADEAITDTESALGALYQQAEAAGDEDAKVAIMAAWGRAQQLHGQLHTTHAALVGTGATMQKLAEQRDVIAAELDSLLEAINEGDVHDHRLADFASDIEADAYTWASESAQEYADESAQEELYNQIYSTLNRYGMSYAETTSAVDILLGDAELNAEQVEMLKMLLESARRDDEVMS